MDEFLKKPLAKDTSVPLAIRLVVAPLVVCFLGGATNFFFPSDCDGLSCMGVGFTNILFVCLTLLLSVLFLPRVKSNKQLLLGMAMLFMFALTPTIITLVEGVGDYYDYRLAKMKEQRAIAEVEKSKDAAYCNQIGYVDLEQDCLRKTYAFVGPNGCRLAEQKRLWGFSLCDEIEKIQRMNLPSISSCGLFLQQNNFTSWRECLYSFPDATDAKKTCLRQAQAFKYSAGEQFCKKL